jgi:hypothetical protein
MLPEGFIGKVERVLKVNAGESEEKRKSYRC